MHRPVATADRDHVHALGLHVGDDVVELIGRRSGAHQVSNGFVVGHETRAPAVLPRVHIHNDANLHVVRSVALLYAVSCPKRLVLQDDAAT